MIEKTIVIKIKEEFLSILLEEAKKNHRLLGPQCSYIVESWAKEFERKGE